MKQTLIAVVLVLCLVSVLIAAAASIDRAKHLPEQPMQTETDTQPPTKPDAPYEIDYEVEAELGKTFTQTNVIMQVTGNVNVRTEPSSRWGQVTVIDVLEPGELVVCVGYGENWNRVLIDGKIYYVSSEYLIEVSE